MWTLLNFPFVRSSRQHLSVNPLDRANVTQLVVRRPKDTIDEDSDGADEDDDDDNNGDEEKPRVTSLSPGSQFGKRHMYGRLLQKVRQIYEAEKSNAARGGDRLFKHPNEFDVNDDERDEMITFYHLLSFYNCTSIKNSVIEKLEKAGKLFERDLFEPIVMDKEGWPQRALRMHTDNAQPEQGIGKKRRRTQMQSAEPKSFSFMLVSRNRHDPEEQNHEPSLLFTMRQQPRIINLSPHIPINVKDERSCHAILLMHVPWPPLEDTVMEDVRAIAEMNIRGGSPSCAERISALDLLQKTIEDEGQYKMT